jgi:hypothetical protein
MKNLILAVMILAAAPAMADKQRLGDGVTQKQVSAAKGMIKYNGYRCDSVDSMLAHTFSVGFTVVCNNYSYRYELKDIGGNWRVYVK